MNRIFLFFLLLFPIFAQAAEGPWQRDEDMAVRLLAERTAVGKESEILFGFDIDLSKGGHIYWRAPGPTGLPPVLNRNESENVAEATLLFPTPHRFGTPPMDAIGYEGRVLLPVRVVPEKPGAPVTLKGTLNLLLCKDLCLPKTFPFALTVPSGAALPSESHQALRTAIALIPKSGASSGLKIVNVLVQEKTLYVTVESDRPLSENVDIFFEGPNSPFFAPPIVKKKANGTHATLETRLSGNEPFPNPATLVATLVDGERAVTQALKTVIESETTARLSTPSLSWALLLALAGGLLLNLMPCVLPVLSLKLMTVLKQGGRKKRLIRRAFLSTASGIVFSFLALAGATVALKAAGHAVGWGAQFQQPVFLVFLIVVLTFFAASLWGLYEFALPGKLASVLEPSRHPYLNGDFAGGALATLLATPCSAPFLGTAVSFALAASWIDIFSVFFALGIGMALPYLIVAFVPKVASRLPKPGAWMETLSKILGIGLAGTAVWLTFVLASQIGSVKASLVGTGMLVVLGLFFLRRRKAALRPCAIGAGVVLGGVFALAFLATPIERAQARGGQWTVYDPEILARNLDAGKTVFVNVTADWCLTCKANKQFVLTDKRVAQHLFASEETVAMEADWTNPDPTVTEFLHHYGRYGVPFSIVFGPGFPQGHALPELLTPSIVLEGLSRAQGQTCALKQTC